MASNATNRKLSTFSFQRLRDALRKMPSPGLTATLSHRMGEGLGGEG
jgi:hypothetical protein